jgi:hypothetical protein
MGLDIGKSFTFVTEDPRWVSKVLIGGGLTLAMSLGFALFVIPGLLVFAIISGYLLALTRNVINGNPQPLPEWDDFGAKMRDGFKALVVGLVYGLPIVLIVLIFFVPFMLSAFTNNDGAMAAGFGFLSLGICLGTFAGILSYVVLPIGMGRLAASNGDIGTALRVGEVFATLRQNIGMYLIVALLSYFVVGFIASLGLIACGIGVLFTTFYAQLTQYHLYGQAHRQTQGLMQPAYGSPYGGGPGPYGGQRPF